MRLRVLEKGHRPRQKFLLAVLRLMPGARAQFDIIRTLLYRPEYFGRDFLSLTQAVMRGPSNWSVGEREFFAAFTSKLNECRFCVGTHRETTSQALGDAWNPELLEDWRRAPLDERMRATLSFLEKLTLTPVAVGAADVAAMRSAGISDPAIEDAICVSLVFNTINRVADALDFHVGSRDEFAKAARMLLVRGYRT